MKVLVFTRDFPPELGGVQTLMERIAAHYGADAVVVARRVEGDAEFDRGRPYRVRRMPRLDWRHPHERWNKVVRAFAYLLRFLIGGIIVGEEVRKHRPDIVICAYAFGNGLPMTVVRLLTGCRFAVYCHGTETLRAMMRGGVRLRALKWVLRLAHRVVVHSRFMRDEVVKLAPADKIVINQLGADSGGLDPAAAPAETAGALALAGKKVIVTVGRMELRKGHDIMIEALPLIAAKHPEAVWVVVGDGPERLKLQAMAAGQKLADRVAFTGRLPDAEVSRLLARADVFVMLSRQIGPDIEAFGIVYLEAALFGVPSVAGRSGGVPDAVEDGVTGLLCEPTEAAEAAEKINRLLDDEPLRRRLGDAARERAQQRTWRACVERLQHELGPVQGPSR